MSKISVAMVKHQVPVQPVMHLQPGQWSMKTAIHLRAFIDGADSFSYGRVDSYTEYWTQITAHKRIDGELKRMTDAQQPNE